MISGLRTWIFGLSGAAIITALCMTITPDSKVKKVVSLSCGMLMILIIIRPISNFDYRNISFDINNLRREAEHFTSDMTAFNEKLQGLIIEEASSAYILDKGTELGIYDLKAEVRLGWSANGYWYPNAAVLTTAADKEQRDKLGRIIYETLGIPPEELIWSMNYEE